MKVRVDVYVGETSYFDTQFLEKRTKWLPYTGIYLEFILKGAYNEKIDFNISSSSDEILVSRHSWNRFFLNIKNSGTVTFELMLDGKSFMKSEIPFNVVDISLPLLFSLPSLMSYPIKDVRFFANRLAENLVNGTRMYMFTPKHLESLIKVDFNVDETTFWKLYELIFSILTERGVTIFITPFDSNMAYSLSFVRKLRESLLSYIEKGRKFRIVWDLTSGLGDRELGGMIDSAVNRFNRDVPLIVPEDKFNTLGGEGFSFYTQSFTDGKNIPINERGVKVARFKGEVRDYYTLRTFARTAVGAGWGVEYVCPSTIRNLRKMRFSLSRALYQGYCDETVND